MILWHVGVYSGDYTAVIDVECFHSACSMAILSAPVDR